MTTTYETILVETDARGVATVTLNRPDKHNALNGDLIAELFHAVEDLASDDKVRIVILTGAGKSFCAGGDFNWFASNVKNPAPGGSNKAPRWRICCADWTRCESP